MEEVENYIKALGDYTNDRKKVKELYLSKSVDYLRSNYPKFINEVGYSFGKLNNVKESLGKLTELTQKGVESEKNSRKIDEEIVAILNSSRVGTLQGITRQTIRENDIKPNPDDKVAETVVNQPYDERSDIKSNLNTGGRKRKRKTNKKLEKQIKKTRKNKYKY
jgi:hypothetical protein